MITCMKKIDALLEWPRDIAEMIVAPLLLLSFRLYVGWVFLKSGIGRFQDFINGSWDTQLFLFEMEHPVPFLSANIAAPVTTFFELFLPVLLISGVFGRFAAAGLLVMTLVIEFTYNHNPDILIRSEHLVWASMLAVIFVAGAGKLSIDHFFVKWLRNKT